MKICPVCRIEIASDADHCPLCGTDLSSRDPTEEPPADAGTGAGPGAATPASRELRPTSRGPGRGPRLWIWEAETLVAFAGIVVALAADLAVDLSVSWSLYPMAAIGWGWLSVTAAFFLRRWPQALASVEMALLLAFLAVLDLLVPGRPWFVPLALPIALFVGIGVGILVLRRNRAVLSNYALGLTLIGLLLGVVEMAVSRFFTGTVRLSWSILTFGCLLPIVVLLLYLQHRVKYRSAELRKYFHV
ncbi:MAG: DUF6320 domain-containing protein [Spirochaetota bacterium]